MLIGGFPSNKPHVDMEENKLRQKVYGRNIATGRDSKKHIINPHRNESCNSPTNTLRVEAASKQAIDRKAKIDKHHEGGGKDKQ